MIRICQRCGCEFDGHFNALYCADCGLERKRERERETSRRNYQPKPPRVCKCAICGKEFETQKRAKYCSPKCAAQARKAQRQKRYLEHREQLRQRRRKEPSSLKCQRCGREFDNEAPNAKYCLDCRPIVKREQIREHKRRWNKAHPEKNREYKRRQYYKNVKRKLIRKILSAEAVNRDD